jgi:hypothetical protein
MSMPKGTKFKSGYATVTNQGMGYREIAEEMTSGGCKMNHATARNHFLRAMEKIAKPMVGLIGGDLSAKDLAQNPSFQESLADIMSEPSK